MLVLAIIALGVPLAINLSARVRAEVRTQAQSQADLIAATAADLLGATQRPELSTLARTAATSLRGRILIVNRSGRVLVDSAGTAQVGRSYESRPEIAAALRGRQIQVQRNSKTLGKEILATAAPIIRAGRPVGAVRVTQSITAVNSAVGHAQLGLALIGFIVLALGLLAGAVIAAQVGRPIRRLEQVARRVARGNLDARAELEGSREQRSLAGSFNDMTERISSLLGAQSAFVADASHQLRTPLTGLRLRLEEARASDVGPSATAQLDGAIDEVDRLARTVDELLTLSAAGERQLQGTEVDLRDVAQSASARWEPAAKARGIRLVSSSPRQSGTVWVARADVDRALDCLVENAINYSPPGTAIELYGGPVEIEVRDRGPGIPANEREDVFHRFHRGRAGRAGAPGSGLGLSIARELARAWDGDIVLADRESGGLVARLELPTRLERAEGLRPLNPEATSVPRA